jgi:hypothetical protein
MQLLFSYPHFKKPKNEAVGYTDILLAHQGH